MYRWDIAAAIRTSGLVAIVRTAEAAEAVAAGQELLESGVTAVEVSLTVPDALAVISNLVARAPVGTVIGAGTVLDAPSARAAILAGARFLVSPSIAVPVIATAARYGCVSVPGAATATEIVTALEAGADLVKFFPADSLGIDALRAIHAALPQAPLVPTGGIDVDDVAPWFEAGAVAVGLGSALTRGAADDIRRRVRHLQEELARVRDHRGHG